MEYKTVSIALCRTLLLWLWLGWRSFSLLHICVIKILRLWLLWFLPSKGLLAIILLLNRFMILSVRIRPRFWRFLRCWFRYLLNTNQIILLVIWLVLFLLRSFYPYSLFPPMCLLLLWLSFICHSGCRLIDGLWRFWALWLYLCWFIHRLYHPLSCLLRRVLDVLQRVIFLYLGQPRLVWLSLVVFFLLCWDQGLFTNSVFPRMGGVNATTLGREELRQSATESLLVKPLSVEYTSFTSCPRESDTIRCGVDYNSRCMKTFTTCFLKTAAAAWVWKNVCDRAPSLFGTFYLGPYDEKCVYFHTFSEFSPPTCPLEPGCYPRQPILREAPHDVFCFNVDLTNLYSAYYPPSFLSVETQGKRFLLTSLDQFAYMVLQNHHTGNWYLYLRQGFSNLIQIGEKGTQKLCRSSGDCTFNVPKLMGPYVSYCDAALDIPTFYVSSEYITTSTDLFTGVYVAPYNCSHLLEMDCGDCHYTHVYPRDENSQCVFDVFNVGRRESDSDYKVASSFLNQILEMIEYLIKKLFVVFRWFLVETVVLLTQTSFFWCFSLILVFVHVNEYDLGMAARYPLFVLIMIFVISLIVLPI